MSGRRLAGKGCSDAAAARPDSSGKAPRALGAIWQSGQWLFGTAVVLALSFGLFANERSSWTQVALVLAVKAVHLTMLWVVLPLRSSGWQACIVDVQELVLLLLAAALMQRGASAPSWVGDLTVWMFPTIIGTMLVGDALALGWKGLQGAARGVRSVYFCCARRSRA